jgi:hypothetical protein
VGNVPINIEAAEQTLGAEPGCLSMNNLDPNVLIDISKTVAAIDERTKASEKQADHRHSNVMTAIQNFVPRREIESENQAIRDYAKQLATDTKNHCDANREAIVHRVESIEGSLGEIKNAAKGFRNWLMGVLGTAVVAAITYVGAHFIKAPW